MIKIFRLLVYFTLLLFNHNLKAQVSIAVVEFEGKGLKQLEASILSDRLRTELFQTGKFTVVEREMMEEILSEQGFQLTGCTSNECIVEIGRIISVEQMVGGSVSKFGDLFSISARIISVETGQITNTATYDHEGKVEDLLKFGMKNVAQNLAMDHITEQSTDITVLSPNGNVTSYKKLQEITDIDGNVYNIIVIGTQVWMAENLKVTHYRNGDAIPNVTDATEWSNLTTGAYCNDNNNSSNADTYGSLYNWYSVNDSRSISPEGWHVPSDAEWKTLEMYLGMNQSDADDIGLRGTDEGGKLKEAGTTHWGSPNTGATDESGFSTLPGDYRLSSGYYSVGYTAGFWSSSEIGSYNAWNRTLGRFDSKVFRGSTSRRYGFSVRCVRD